MRVLGLTVAAMLAVTVATAGHAAPSGSSMKQLVQVRTSSKYGAAVVGVGTRCPAIGAGGEADGFPRIARPTTIMADGIPTVDRVHTALSKAPTEDGVLTALRKALRRMASLQR
jgi:hypothetical protein